MPQLSLKRLTPSDLPTLRDISISTFEETFSHLNSEENMRKYLDESLSLTKLTEEFHTEGSEFFFAMIGEEVIGYLKINTGEAQTEPVENALEIERIYIRKEYQGMRAGKLLLDHAFRSAWAKGLTTVWLGVWEKNTKAIGFYEKHGFTRFGQHIFNLGEEQQVDLLFKCEMLFASAK